MTRKAIQRGEPDRADSSVVELIAAMQRITGLLQSSLGTGANGLPTELGQACFAQLKAAAADLAEAEPASLDDLAALVAYARAHCSIGAQASRDFDPVIATEHLEVAGALLAKASTQLRNMTGQPAAELGLGHRLN